MRRKRLQLLASAALAVLTTVVSWSLPATAASLQLAGPAGASVTIDGRTVGFLPLDGPLVLAPGLYEVVCELAGRQTFRETVPLMDDNEWRHVTVRLLPYSRKTAVASNLLLAGLGPRYLGHRTRGWFYAGVEVGGLVAALTGELTRTNANREHLGLLDEYNQAVNADDIARLRQAAEAKRQEVTDAANRRDLGLMTAAAAVIVSMVDAYLSFPSLEAGSGELPLTVGTGGPALGASPAFHSAVRLSF